jgi:hypothetical protein
MTMRETPLCTWKLSAAQRQMFADLLRPGDVITVAGEGRCEYIGAAGAAYAEVRNQIGLIKRIWIFNITGRWA